jgi:hypothetical protein
MLNNSGTNYDIYNILIRVLIFILMIVYFIYLKKELEDLILYQVKDRKYGYKPHRRLRKYYYIWLILTFIIYIYSFWYRTDDYVSIFIYNSSFLERIDYLQGHLIYLAANISFIDIWTIYSLFLFYYFWTLFSK